MARTNKRNILAIICLVPVILLLISASTYLQVQHSSIISDSAVQNMLDHVEATLDERLVDIQAQLSQRAQNKLCECRLVAFSLGSSNVKMGELPDYSDNELEIFEKLVDKETTTYAYLVDRNGNLLLPFCYCDFLSPNETVYCMEYGSINVKELWGFTEEQWQELLAGTGEKDSDGYVIREPYRMVRTTIGSASGLTESTDCVIYCAEVPSFTENEDSGLYVLCAEQYRVVIASMLLTMNVDFANNTASNVDFYYHQESKVDYMVPDFLETGNLSGLRTICKDGFHGDVETVDGIRTVDTRKYYNCLTEEYIYLFAVRDQAGLKMYNYVLSNAFIALAAIVLFGALGWFFKQSRANTPCAADCKRLLFGLPMNRLILRKLRPAFLVCLIAALLGSWLSTSLCCISNSMRSISARQDQNIQTIEDAVSIQNCTNESRVNELLRSTELLADYLNISDIACIMIDYVDADELLPYYYVNKDGYTRQVCDINGTPLTCRVNNFGLQDYCKDMGMDSATIYSLDGYAILTTQSEKPDRITSESPLYSVLLRQKNNTVSSVGTTGMDVAVPVTLYMKNDVLEGQTFISKSSYEAAVLTGGTDVSRFDGILVTRKTVQKSQTIMGLESALEQIQDNSEESYLTMAFSNDDDRTPIYVPELLSGGNPDSMDLPSGLLEDTYYGFAWLNGARYLLCSRFVQKTDETQAYWMVTALNAGSVYQNRLHAAACTLVCVLLSCLLIMAVLAYMGKKEREALPEQRVQPDIMVLDVSEKNSVILPWHLRTPEQKTFTLLRWFFFVFVIVLGIKAVLQINRQGTISVLNWIVTRRWDRGINIFSITAVGFIFCIVLTVTYMLSKLIQLVSGSIGKRMATCLSVLSSVLKYSAIIFSIFYGLFLMGMDTSSVLTSFGAFSLLVGLGANKLIGDIIAGVFLVIENEFHVGDIVTINGFCGKVIEIGIRTTKVENMDGNVNIFTNSTVNNVLNMTSKISRVKIDLSVLTDNSVEVVESMLQDALTEIDRKCEIPHKNLRYVGVDKVGRQECVYRIEAECNEYLCNELYRYLNRELYLSCKKYGISIK